MTFVSKLQFVKKQLENDDVYTFYFTKPTSLSHSAGQHGLFVLPGFYRPHPFTISSSPDEEHVTISTHVNTGSRYKKKLMSMKAGTSVLLFGPILNFSFRKDINEYVFLAQGIGITPFRSMLVSAHHTSLPVVTTLIHIDSNKHSFRHLTQAYATKSFYPTTADEFRKLVTSQNTSQQFYLSGSPGFVRTTRELLTKQGVSSDNITTDSFLGY